VAESDKEVIVRAEIPGIDPKELDVTVTGNQLVVSGEKKESTEKKDKGFYHNETRYGSFRRVIPLPEGVDSEHVDAQYANGVLTLKLQKTPAAAAKKIEIKTKE
jgi:HSP20 family protein